MKSARRKIKRAPTVNNSSRAICASIPKSPPKAGHDNLGIGYPRVPEAMPEKIEAEEAIKLLQPAIDRYQARLDGQQKTVDVLGFASPAILMQSILYNLAGTGKTRHENLLRQVNDFNRNWNDYFDAFAFQRKMLTAADYERFPSFAFREEAAVDIIGRVAFPLL